MSIPKAFIVSVTLAAIAAPVQAADYSDPTWPCVQRKVESLSLGLMWPFPPGDAEPDATLEKDALDLADALALRRVNLDDIRPQVDAFAATYEGDPAALTLVFQRVFDRLSKRRSRIISGIGKFSLSQIALAEQIDLARVEMDKTMAMAEPDFDKVDKLEERIDWDQIIHSDRQRSITYLCETPQLLERRLFSIAQMLQQVAQD